MIRFHPDGLIQTKQKICQCPNCFKGHFVQCVDENGLLYYTTGESDGESSSSESNTSDDEKSVVDENDNDDENELLSANVLEVVNVGKIIALFAKYFICAKL